MWIAMAKQATTIATQVALAALDLAVEMCTRPWIVELSRNSLKDAIFAIMPIYLAVKNIAGLCNEVCINALYNRKIKD